MSRVSPRATYRSIFNDALVVYREKTGKDLTSDPLLRNLEFCKSPDDIIILLRKQTQRDNIKWTKWLKPIVTVLDASSKIISLINHVRQGIRTHPSGVCS